MAETKWTVVSRNKGLRGTLKREKISQVSFLSPTISKSISSLHFATEAKLRCTLFHPQHKSGALTCQTLARNRFRCKISSLSAATKAASPFSSKCGFFEWVNQGESSEESSVTNEALNAVATEEVENLSSMFNTLARIFDERDLEINLNITFRKGKGSSKGNGKAKESS
ncbi:uncharacterized protein LOC111377240 [Olea europaea var. sylvestris]|uniref:uncharacterized protein LOC111377240 n=1 Tax=Olea europaea var. sylvestris TaxID=158386 RepID=UPI000C1D86EE|nr:uncharacterized protein LOC111377240 [Olea europaea var. sylvestris]